MLAAFLATAQLILGCIRNVLAPTLFDTVMDHVLGWMSEMSDCGVSFQTVRITDLEFADDAVIFLEITDVLPEALKSLSEGAKPLGLRVSCIKVQEFGDILDVTTYGFNSCEWEDVEIPQMFTFIGKVIHSSTSRELGVNRPLGGMAVQYVYDGGRKVIFHNLKLRFCYSDLPTF